FRLFAVGISTLLVNILPNFVKFIEIQRKLLKLEENFPSRDQLVNSIVKSLRTCGEWNSTKRALEEFYGISVPEPMPSHSTLQTLRQSI
ncbi:hypothetical protein PMAYCL1PPCAC_10731, partial [Pristionchus mayeri]